MRLSLIAVRAADAWPQLLSAIAVPRCDEGEPAGLPAGFLVGGPQLRLLVLDPGHVEDGGGCVPLPCDERPAVHQAHLVLAEELLDALAELGTGGLEVADLPVELMQRSY